MTSSALYDFWKNLQTPKPEWDQFEKMATHCLIETETIVAAWRQEEARKKYAVLEKNEIF